MKRIIVFLIVFMTCAYANDQELFLQANELYKEKNYQQACALYNNIKHKGPATWYNMGNCAYQMGDVSCALVYWRMANRGASHSLRKAIAHNSAHAREKDAALQSVTLAEEIVDALCMCSSYVSLFMWQIIVLLGWIVGWYVFMHHRTRQLLLVIIIIINLISGLLLLVRFWEMNRVTACVTQPGITLFAGPNTCYHAVGTVDEVACVHVQSVEGEWCQICYKQLLGWVPKAKLELV